MYNKKVNALALIVEKAQKPTGLAFDEMEATGIVAVPYIRPSYTLFPVLSLLVLKDMLIEVMLQLLVRVIYAQLLETVACLEVLESEDIEYAYAVALVVA